MCTCSAFLKTSVAAGPNAASSRATVGRAFLQRVRERARLLMDFLEHEVAVQALLGAPRRKARFRCTARSIELPSLSSNANALALDLRDVAFFQEDEAAGDGQQRRHVGGDEVFFDAEADDDRGSLRARG